MPFADIGSLGLQETNGCVCYSMPFGFLEQGKTAVFVSDAILFVYFFLGVCGFIGLVFFLEMGNVWLIDFEMYSRNLLYMLM